VLQNNRFKGREFPAFRWRANWGQLDPHRGTRNEGDNESVQGADLQEAPEDNDVPAIDDAAGSILHEEDNRSEQEEGPSTREHEGNDSDKDNSSSRWEYDGSIPSDNIPDRD
jgi:hypothetical protein